MPSNLGENFAFTGYFLHYFLLYLYYLLDNTIIHYIDIKYISFRVSIAIKYFIALNLLGNVKQILLIWSDTTL